MPQDHSFKRLHDAGFSHLLPIIPQDATISSHSRTLQGREDALGKIPGKRVQDGWVGLAGWEHHEATKDELAEWDEDGAGVGMRCSGVVAVDIDVTDADLVKLIYLEAITHLGFGPKRTGNAPKCLMLFRVDDDLPTKRSLSFQDPQGNRQLIELLGARQQFVVAGIHPKTGKPYTWNEDLTEEGYAGLPRVTHEDLETFLAACADVLEVFDCEHLRTRTGHDHDARSPAALAAPDLDVLEETVAEIPNGEEHGYEDLTTMAHACWAAGLHDREKGLAILQRWSDKWPHGADPNETERIYWSVHESSIGAQWLYDQAREAGVDTVAADFGEVAANEDLEEDDEPPGGLRDRYVYVNGLKRFIERKTGLRLDKEMMNDKHMLPDAKQTPSKWFLEHRTPTCFVDQTDYLPGCHDVIYKDKRSGRWLYNTWRPGPAHDGSWLRDVPKDQCVRLWLRLVEHLIPDPEERKILLDWMAFIIQYPGVKPSWHPLVGSTIHGCGKDSMFAPLIRGLGDNARTITAADLENQWTHWAEDVQLVVASEMYSFERRAVANKLKSYMAAPPDTISINIKGLPQFDVRNTFGLVMFSNNEDAVALEKGDRRFFVLWIESAPLEDAFYEKYHAWLEDGGAAEVINWLHHRDISVFNAKGRAPETAAKTAMREAAMGQLEGLLHAGIEDDKGPFKRDLVTMDEIMDWLRPQVNRLPGPHKMAAILKTVGCLPLGRARMGDERVRLYACRRARMYQEQPVTMLRNLLIEQREKTSGATVDFSEEWRR